MGAHRADPFLSAVGVLEEEPRRVELDGEPPGLERRLHRAPGARSLCGPPIECGDQTLEKSRLIFLARETRAFSGLASVRASHSRTRVWRHTRTRTAVVVTRPSHRAEVTDLGHGHDARGRRHAHTDGAMGAAQRSAPHHHRPTQSRTPADRPGGRRQHDVQRHRG